MYSKQLDTFIKVAEAGSFSKAASTLFVTPSAVIQQINLLESELDSHLFIRTNSGIKLTEAGKVLLEDAREIVRQCAAAKNRVKQAGTDAGKCIRVGTDLLRKCLFFPDFWTRFVLSEPHCKTRFAHYEGELDVGSFNKNYDILETLALSGMWKQGFEFLELFRCPSACAVPKNHRLAGKASVSLADLSGEKLAYIRRGYDGNIDAARNRIEQYAPDIELVDIEAFDESAFSTCRLNFHPVQIPLCIKNICTGFVAIPCEWDCSQPYGFLYSKKPPEHVRRFLDFVGAEAANRGPDYFLEALRCMQIN